MQTERATFIRLIEEICHEKGWTCSTFSQGWLLRIGHVPRQAFIFGYYFDVNPLAAARICQDKAATSLLLADAGIPHVPHQLFHRHLAYQEGEGNWPRMLAYFRQHGGRLVVKPNEGSSGTGVEMVTSVFELEQAVYERFRQQASLCFSPFVPIRNEYRLVVLRGEVLLAYRKCIPQLQGDGESSVLELLMESAYDSPEARAYLQSSQPSLYHIPEAGEAVALNWKHNLGRGARAELLPQGPLRRQLADMALRACRSLNMRFASVDLIEAEGVWRVLEVNAGIMLVHFARSKPQHYALAKGVYARALEEMMGEHSG